MNKDETTAAILEDELISKSGVSPTLFSSEGDKHCPHCGRSISPNATMCGFCAFIRINQEINGRR